MIIYNTIMGVAAGLALIMVPLFVYKLAHRKRLAPEGWSLSFGVLGLILAPLGAVMSTTWPLFARPHLNIMFGEPSMFLGLLLLAAAVFIWARRDVIAAIGSDNKKESDEAYAYFLRVAKPVSWVLFALGLILLSTTIAILRFVSVGGAPESEPITGRLHDYPYIENTFFVVLYGLAAVGSLLAPFALRDLKGTIAKIIVTAFLISGVSFLLFSAMNYYTHTGQIINHLEDKNYKW